MDAMVDKTLAKGLHYQEFRVAEIDGVVLEWAVTWVELTQNPLWVRGFEGPRSEQDASRIIEREGILVFKKGPNEFWASRAPSRVPRPGESAFLRVRGESAHVAAMRFHVIARCGPVIKVPRDLLDYVQDKGEQKQGSAAEVLA